MENPNARLASHIGLWIIVLVIGVWLIYSATHTNTENNRYASGASSTDEKHEGFRLVDRIDLFNFSCAPHDTLIPKNIKPKDEVKK